MNNEELKRLLNTHGLRATPNRLSVLMFMEKQKHPIGIEILKESFPRINEVTLYRMATDFVEKGIWNSCDVGHGHVDFESANKPHHHHAVCESCGMIEEIYGCKNGCRLLATMKKEVKDFAVLHTPSMAIFGLCRTCGS